jgi:uncharacterized RDD family membrane protein YckC
MEREFQLNFCKRCKNQKFSIKSGLICRLTNQAAAFEESCTSFEEDKEMVNRLNKINISDNQNSSTGKRFANYILDAIFYLIFSLVIGSLLGIFFAVFYPSLLTMFDSDNKILNYIYGFCVMSIYYLTSEALTGRTLAKLITRTKVVNENGNLPSFNAVVLRTLCRFIPFDALSFFSQDNLGWHDRLSKTKVVDI